MAYTKIRTFTENDGMSYTGDPDSAAWVYAEVWEQVNTSANTSDVRIDVYIRNDDAYRSWDSNIPYTMHIAGTLYSGSVLDFEEPVQGETIKLFTKTKTGIAHNSDGSKSINIDFFFDTGMNAIGDITLPSTSITLTTIPRAATITSFPNFNIGSVINVTVTNPGSFELKVTLKARGSTVVLIEEGYSGTSLQISLDAGELAIIYQDCEEDKTLPMLLRIDTLVNGSSIGYSEAWCTATVINSEPIFTTCTYQDIRAETLALTDDSSVIVLGQSNVKVTVPEAYKAVAQNYAYMKTYLAKIGDKQTSANYSAISDVDMLINAVASNEIYVLANDSRGFSTKSSVITATALNYLAPYISTISLVRDNGIDSTTRLSFSGVLWPGDFGLVVNSLSYAKYRYKETDSSTWSAYIDLTAGVSVDGSGNLAFALTAIGGDLGGSGFNIDKSFDFEVHIKDALVEYTYSLILDVGKPGLYVEKFSDGNYGIGFGKVPTQGRSIDAVGPIYANDGEECLTSSSILTFYPVGSIYRTSSSTFNPATVFGGTWELINKIKEELKIVNSTSSTHFTKNSTNVESFEISFMISNNNLFVRLKIVSNVAFGDTTLELGTINFSSIGLSEMGFMQYIYASSDGGNGASLWQIDYSGVVSATDIISKSGATTLSAPNSFFGIFTAVLNKELITDGIAEYVWERTA